MRSEELLATLERFFTLDPQAAHAFFLQRTAVNDAVRDDPQLPVGKLGATSVITPLLLLNSLLDDGKIIDALQDQRGQLSGFQLRDRVESDSDGMGALHNFISRVTLQSHPAYVRGRAKVGDRVLILDVALARLRTQRADAWQSLVAATTRLGVVDTTDHGYLRVQLGEPPNLTPYRVVVAEDEVRMHNDDWLARYGRLPEA